MSEPILVLSHNAALSGLIARILRWREVYSTILPVNTKYSVLQEQGVNGVVLAADTPDDTLLDELAAFAAEKGATLAAGPGGQDLLCVYEGKEVALSVSGSPYSLAVGTLQAFLDCWLESHPTVRLDYIHGEETVRALAAGENVTGFLLPTPSKDALLPTVRREGALPRKTFSMGSANEKRYYMEARQLLRP